MCSVFHNSKSMDQGSYVTWKNQEKSVNLKIDQKSEVKVIEFENWPKNQGKVIEFENWPKN